MTQTRTTIWPLVLLWYALFLPPQVTVNVAGSLIYGYRIAIIIGLPFAVQALSKVRRSLWLADVMVPVSGIIPVISIGYNQGLAVGLTKGLPIAIDLISVYIIARSCVRDLNDFKRVLVYMAPVFLLVGCVVMAESVTHQLIIKPWADAVFGARRVVGTRVEDYGLRLGLSRGMGPFSHPILAGLCLSLALPLYWSLSSRHDARMPRLIGLAAGGLAVFSVSSSAFLSLVISGALLGYDALTRRVAAFRWDVLVTILAVAGGVIQIFYKGGLLKFGIRFAFSGDSAWYRYAEWEYGDISVSQNPFLGIGFADYSRPEWMASSSVDSLWLYMAVSYGIIACVAYAIFVVSAVVNLCAVSNLANNSDKNGIRCLAFAIINLVIAGFSVTYFGGVENWLPLLTGVAVSIAQCASAPELKGFA